MQRDATTVEAYLASLTEDERRTIEAVRAVIKKNLGKGFEEGIQYGMIGYYVPHSRYPEGYHCDPRQPLPFAGLAAQKNNISVYLMSVYMRPGEAERFAKAWQATGKKLDMGKSCVRFKRAEDAALEVIGAAIKSMPLAEYIATYEALRDANKSGAAAVRSKVSAKKPAAKKPAAKKPAAKKPEAKKASAKKQASKKPATKKPATKKAATRKTPTKKSPTK